MKRQHALVLVFLSSWNCRLDAGGPEGPPYTPAFDALQPSATTSSDSRFLSLLEQYESGDRDGAVAAVLDADAEELERQQNEIFHRIDTGLGQDPPEDRARYWRRERVKLAQLIALLATEAAVRLPPSPQSVRLVSMARQAVEILLDLRDEFRTLGPLFDPHATLSPLERQKRGQAEWERLLPFCRQWFLIAAAVAQNGFETREVQRLIDRGLEVFADDPELRLARGSLLERDAAAMVVDRSVVNDLYGRLYLRRVGEQLAAASRELKRSLERAPDLAEAALRLGRVAQLQGDNAGARQRLEQVLAREDAAPFVRYHARLFLAELFESLADPASAEAHYTEAIVLMPVAQAPALGLSRLRDAAGDAVGARRWLVRSLVAVSPDREDPWWRYSSGQHWRVGERLTLFRELRITGPR